MKHHVKRWALAVSTLSLAACAAPTAEEGSTSSEALVDAAPRVTVVANVPSDALDFDVRQNGDILVLSGAATNTQVDRCGTMACIAFVAPTDMPKGVNASIGVRSTWVASLSGGHWDESLLVAQSGDAPCFDNCTVDDPTLPGLFDVAPDRASRRLGPTVPLVFAKASRGTDGWLEGGGERWAVGQSANNEDVNRSYTQVFETQGGTAVSATIVSFDTTQPPAAPFAPPRPGPFTFASVATDGYVGVYDGTDEVNGGKAVQETFTPDALAGSYLRVFARHHGHAALDTFDVHGTPSLRTVKMPESGPDSRLVAVGVGLVDYTKGGAGAKAKATYCTVAALDAGTCSPASIALPFDTIVRTRVVGGDTLYVLGTVPGGATKIVSVAF